MTGAEAVADAYCSCEAITREQAGNFFYGIRLLPAERRRAMCAIYAFARRVDDIGDGALDRDEKLARLDAQERSLEALGTDGAGADDPVVLALADARARFAFPASALGELIEGVRMDVHGATYDSFEQLVPYCRRVAGAIGRVCLPVFGLRADARVDRAQAEALADDLGVAMQLTNILRDVREDAENGRVYLPAEDLRRFGLLDGAPALLAAIARARDGAGDAAEQERERLGALVRFEAGRAREWFARGIALTSLLDRRSAACVTAMAGIYRRLLVRIEADPQQAIGRRLSLPAHEKAWVAARSVLGAALER
ncbi:MAG TPA: squalene/phytoene synthase family protein [Solirubrobacteraceae bacterium]|nr:squalene/phytoene synthase family protein [Solirubrobacteraceae bacterium]